MVIITTLKKQNQELLEQIKQCENDAIALAKDGKNFHYVLSHATKLTEKYLKEIRGENYVNAYR